MSLPRLCRTTAVKPWSHKDLLEGLDGLGRGRLEGGAGKLVEEDQVELAAQVPEGPDEHLCVGRRVVAPAIRMYSKVMRRRLGMG